jgi:hypothetical protein
VCLLVPRAVHRSVNAVLVQVKGRRRRRTRKLRKQVSPDYVPPAAGVVRPRICYALTANKLAASSTTVTPTPPELLLILEGQASTPPTFPRGRASDNASSCDLAGAGAAYANGRDCAASRHGLGSHVTGADRLVGSGQERSRAMSGTSQGGRTKLPRRDSWLGRNMLCCGMSSLGVYEDEVAQPQPQSQHEARAPAAAAPSAARQAQPAKATADWIGHNVVRMGCV